MRINQNNADELSIWEINDEFTIQQTMSLIYGISPEGENQYSWSINKPDAWPKGMAAVLQLIEKSLKAGKLKGTLNYNHQDGMCIYDGICFQDDFHIPDIDYDTSCIKAASLTALFKEKNIQDAFFNNTTSIDNGPNFPSYMDSSHPCYSAKLAAAVQAWLAVSETHDPNDGSTPLKDITGWLEKHAKQYDLLYGDGFNKSAIEEIAKIAHWRKLGGSSRTPSKRKK